MQIQDYGVKNSKKNTRIIWENDMFASPTRIFRTSAVLQAPKNQCSSLFSHPKNREMLLVIFSGISTEYWTDTLFMVSYNQAPVTPETAKNQSPGKTYLESFDDPCPLSCFRWCCSPKMEDVKKNCTCFSFQNFSLQKHRFKRISRIYWKQKPPGYQMMTRMTADIFWDLRFPSQRVAHEVSHILGGQKWPFPAPGTRNPTTFLMTRRFFSHGRRGGNHKTTTIH